MSTAPVTLVNAQPGATGTTYTTGSFTPGANTRVVVFGTAYRSNNVCGKPAISDSLGTLTWTELASVESSNTTTADLYTVIWISNDLGASPAAMTVTVTASPASALTASAVSVLTADTDGTALQTASGEDLSAGDPSFTFAAAPGTSNIVLGCNWAVGGNQITKPTGYTNLYDNTPTNVVARRHEVFYANASAPQGPNQSTSTNLRQTVVAVELAPPSSGGITVNATGSAGTGSPGSVTVSTVANVSVAASGNAATGSVGSPTVTAVQNVSTAVTGNAATGSNGSVTVSLGANVPATGEAATGSVGTVTVSGVGGVIVAVTGNTATGSVGDVTIVTAANIAVSGAEGDTSSGTTTVAGSATIAPSGEAATGNTNDVTVAAGASVNLSGEAATGSVGTVSVKVSDVIVPVTGVEATASAGDMVVTFDCIVAVTGRSATASVGDVHFGAWFVADKSAGNTWGGSHSASNVWTKRTSSSANWTRVSTE